MYLSAHGAMTRLCRSILLQLPASLLLALAAITLAFVYSPVDVTAADKTADKKPLEWVTDLKSPTQGTRTRATDALAKLKPTPPEVAIATADLLKDEEWSVRAQVLMVLGNMGTDASIVLPQIIATLNDENEHVRRSAANTLTRVPATTSETRMALVRALEVDDRHLRSQAGRALAAAAPADSATIAPELARIATSDNRQASGAAFNVLEKLPATDVVPVLVPMLSSDDQQTRQNAARVIGTFGYEASAAVPTLITLLDKYPHYLMAVHTLGRIGPGAKAAIPALLALFERSDPSRQLRLAVTGALARIGPEPQQVLPLFREELALQDMSEASGRYRAALAGAILTISGPDDPAIRSYVKRLARDQRSWQPFTRVEAVKGLVAMGSAAAPAMDALRDSLRKDKEPKIRALAAQALGEIGSAAYPALPDLRKAQQEDEAYVSKRAAAAIVKIEASTRTTTPVATTIPLVPVDEHAERQKEIAADIAALSVSGSRRARASLRLLERAPDSLPAMHRALLAPDTKPQDRSRLIALVQDLGDPRTVVVIIKTAKATPEQPGLLSDTLRALAELPPSPASFEFATRVLEDPRAIVQVQRQALLYFAKHRDQRGAQWAEHFANDDDAYMRIVSLYLAASLGDPQALQPIATLLQEQPRHTARYALLLGLADLTDLTEFEKLTRDQPKDKEYESVLRLTSLRITQGEERVALALQMLNSRFPNERRIAMDVLLKANAVSELTPLLKKWGSVPPQTRATIAAGLYRAGYQFVERDRSLEIKRLPPISKDASAW
jgi:HEAT repeat protein